MLEPKMQDARNEATVSGDAATLLLTPLAQQTFAAYRAVRVSSENIRLEKFSARVYLNKVGAQVVSIRVDRYKHGMQVWENPSASSIARVRTLIREERGW